MEKFLMNLIEFVIELSVVTSGLTLITVGLSIAILRNNDLYRQRASVIGVPIVIAIIIGAAGPDDHTNLRQWAYYVLPNLALSLLFVSSYCRNRAQKIKPSQGQTSPRETSMN